MAGTVSLPAVEALDALVAVLRDRGHVVVGPTVRDGAIVLDELRGAADLPAGWVDEQEAGHYELRHVGDGALFAHVVGPQSPRRYLAPPRRLLWTARRDGDGFALDDDADGGEAPDAPLAFVGVRACELAAIGVQDRVLADGPHPDADYVARRRGAFLVGVDCARPAATCFCASMGTGPAVTGGADLILSELADHGHHRVLATAASDRAAGVLDEVLERVPGRPATAGELAAAAASTATAARAMVRRLDPAAARDVLVANLDHPRWADVADRCLSCTNCTLVCPTCFCTAVEDVTSLDGVRAERVLRWDSCFTLGHSALHGGGSVRADTRSRYRQWLVHKLSTWWDQFGESGCVGCGRCITWCPAAIDLTEEVAALAHPATAPEVAT